NKRRIPFEFNERDDVLVNPHTLKMSGIWQNQGHKLLPRFEGPFQIIEKLGPKTYRIAIPADWESHNVLNI
ncbi:hypothetical protein M408DRAFT_33250, partial [Serendipita vermifera MAFF 305830]